jgi:N-acetylmuramoyl-L-alanine amidase
VLVGKIERRDIICQGGHLKQLDGTGPAIALVVLTICAVSLQNTIKPAGIVIHHSALTAADLDEFPGLTDVSVIDAMHKKRGYQVYYWGHLYHVGYHYVILPDGTVQAGRPENCIGAHAQGHNDSIGICLIGNFSSVANPDGRLGILYPTPLQIRSLVDLVKDLKARYRLTCSQIWRHQDLKPTTLCPGDRLNWADIQAQIGCGASN